MTAPLWWLRFKSWAWRMMHPIQWRRIQHEWKLARDRHRRRQRSAKHYGKRPWRRRSYAPVENYSYCKHQQRLRRGSIYDPR